MAKNKSKMWDEPKRVSNAGDPGVVGQSHGGLTMTRAADAPSPLPEPPAPPPAPFVPHEEDPMLRFSEVAVLLGVSWQTVERYVNARLLRATYRGDGRVIRKSAVVAFMGKNYTPPNS